MILLIVRHGETDYNKTKRVQGTQQIPLNERGKNQALQVAKSLRQFKITHIYCSGLVRARETAEIINSSFSLPIVKDNRLNERNWGNWESKKRDEILKPGENFENIWSEENLDANPHQGETTRELMKRCVDFLHWIIENHADSDVILVVTHAGPMRMIRGIIKGLQDEEYLRRDIKNGQILIVKYEHARFAIEER
jgi:broad specificity phosphatase PhoE